jgi:peptide/nickel transport system substrate-binding protein
MTDSTAFLRLLRAPAAVAALSLLALGCRPGDAVDDPAGDPVAGGTAVVAVTSDFQAFNPVTNTALVTMEVMNFLLFTPLIQYGDDLEPQPWLAESWDLQEDHVVFRLRNDVFWHDGQPVTAEDVHFTYRMATDEATASLLNSAYLTMVRSATVVDPHTIRFDFVAPHSQPLEAFWWAPVPSHLLQGVAPAQLAQADYNRQPVGSGPFRFVRWDAGQSVTVEANPDFPEGLGGRPYLDRIVFRVVPEATTRLTELMTGAIDLNYTVLPDEVRQLEGQRGVEVLNYSGREFLYVGWNNEREPFRDPAVRRALAMAIDRQQIIDALMFGYGQPSAGMIPPWSPMHPEAEPLPYDPEGARRLLAEAGWTDARGTGVLERDGQPLRFTIMSSENRLRQDITTVLQQQFRQIGADVQVRALEFQTMLAQHRQRDYDAVLSGWSLDNFRVDPTPLFSCEEAAKPESANRAGYCNPQADQYMMAGIRETDEGRAARIWDDFTQVLLQDQPITFLVWSEDLAGRAARLQGVEMDARGRLRSAQRWWIPENRRR